ncbi:MAG: WecB/TagA/CpsF family glycosyltransferase [Candidatus Bipolaricaulia bacterium]
MIPLFILLSGLILSYVAVRAVDAIDHLNGLRPRPRLGRYAPVLALFAIPIVLGLFSGQGERTLGLGLGLVILVAAHSIRRRWAFPVYLDLVAAAVAGAIAYHLGFRIEFLTNPEGGYFYLSRFSLPLTLIWVVVVTQSLSFLSTSFRDGGRLILSIALVSSLAFLIVNLLQSQDQPLFYAIYLVLAILGVTLGILANASRVEETDLVARGLGFSIALLAITGVLKTAISLTLISPILILGIPLMTTAYAIVQGTSSISAERTPFQRLGRVRSGMVFLIYLGFSYISVALVGLTRYPDIRSVALLASVAVVGGAVMWWGKSLASQVQATDIRTELFGVPVDRVTFREALVRFERLIEECWGGMVLTPDVTAVIRARREERLRQIYGKADLVTADGAGLVWASRLLGGPLPERVTGIDMVEAFCARATRNGYTLFLLGARPGIASMAKRRLEHRFPGLNIVGVHHGYFEDDTAVIGLIRATAPDVLLVGLGVPRQEYWVMDHRDELNVPLCMGVGGSFDVLSGRIPRASARWQRFGLEWLYRIVVEPRRFWRDLAIPLFILRVLLAKLGQTLFGRGSRPS